MKVCLAILFACLIFVTACTPSAVAPAEGKLKILTEVYPPYNFVDKNMNVTGQSTEIVQAILNQLDVIAQIEVVSLSEGLELLQKGPAMVMYSLNRTPAREKLFKWVGPIGQYEQVFYARKGSSIQVNRLEDAKQVEKIGVYKGDAGNQYLASQGFTNLDESQTDVEALKKLIDGEVQLWLGNKEGLEITAKEAGVSLDELVLLPTIVIEANLYIAFSKDIPDGTVTKWQEALDVIKQQEDIDGKTLYDKILAKYSDPGYLQSLLR